MGRQLIAAAIAAALVMAGCSQNAEETKDMHLDAPVSNQKISKEQAGAARGDSPETMANMDEHHGTPGGR